MKILSMTATFGGLDGKTLSLTPGLSIITAPNEWGKSTWCAFLMSMLYGIDTRQRIRQGTLPDKERYKPWSGKPMSGSVTLLWQGRKITIERSTQGRVPMGRFRAYETDSGLDIPDLTGENCGLMLLGVERNVYARSGFIAGTSLFSGADDELRRRLELLVSTGDESPTMQRLEERLRDLKNKCQYHKTGALPQAREALRQCCDRLEQQRTLQQQAEQLQASLSQLSQQQESLSAHREYLLIKEHRDKLAQVERARQAEQQAKALLAAAQAQCQSLPAMEQLRRAQKDLDTLEQERSALELEAAMLPAPSAPELPEYLAGMSRQAAEQTTQADADRLRRLEQKAAGGAHRLLLLPALLAAVGGAFAYCALPPQWRYWAAGGLALAALALLSLFFLRCSRRKRAARSLLLLRRDLECRYGGCTPQEAMRTYCDAMDAHAKQTASRTEMFSRRLQAIREKERRVGLDRKALEQAQQLWSDWSDAKRAAVRAEQHRRAMEQVTSDLSNEETDVTSPLSLTMEQTQAASRQLAAQITSTHSRLDSCLGQSRGLPSIEQLEAEASRLRQKEQTLLQWQNAICLSLDLLDQAKRELQGRFAPQLSRRAGEILSIFTQGQYDRLLLQQNFTLLSPGGEDAARESYWRSQGTQEQMYLALRLALSESLIPDAPLILDDALIKFDDSRMAAALEFLAQQDRQVILFSCQSREAQWQQHP